MLKPGVRIGLKILAWLPLLFFGWFGLWFGTAWLCAQLAAPVLAWVDPATSPHLIPQEFHLQVVVTLPPGSPLSHGAMLLYPQRYGYGLPLFVAASLVFDLPARRLWTGLLLGAGAVLLLQVAGTILEVLYVVHIGMAAQIPPFALSQAWASQLLSSTYKFTVLILPGLVPLALWLAYHGQDARAQLDSAERKPSNSSTTPT